MNTERLNGVVSIKNGRPQIINPNALKGLMDDLIYEAVFTGDEEKKKVSLLFIKEMAKEGRRNPILYTGAV